MRLRRVCRGWVRDERAEQVLVFGQVRGQGLQVGGDYVGLGLEGGPGTFISIWLVASLVWNGNGRGREGREAGWRSYHDGSGSVVFRLAISEPSEWVSWIRRWRDCSRVLRASCEGAVIVVEQLCS